MTREQIRARIQEIGIIPGIRVSSPDDALFAAEVMCTHGIPIVEVTMTIPGALEVIEQLTRRYPEMIVGAGSIWHVEMARSCAEAGAKFLTSPGLDVNLIYFAVGRGLVVFPGVLTPSEIMAAWKAGPDFLKIFPCARVGGPEYIKTLRAPFPDIPMIASGGVNQQTAADFIVAGAVALGIGNQLIPPKSIHERQAHRLGELARRFVSIVKEARLPAEERF